MGFRQLPDADLCTVLHKSEKLSMSGNRRSDLRGLCMRAAARYKRAKYFCWEPSQGCASNGVNLGAFILRVVGGPDYHQSRSAGRNIEMRRHKHLSTRLFRKTYRHRPNQRREYLRTRKKTRAKQAHRALRAALRAGADEPLSPLQETGWTRADRSFSLETMTGHR